MSKGGLRKGAGRKTTWKSGCSFEQTTVVRVPRVLKEEVLELAHKIDEGWRVRLVPPKEEQSFLNCKKLAQRCNLPTKELLAKVESPSFSSWIQEKDPEGKSWGKVAHNGRLYFSPQKPISRG